MEIKEAIRRIKDHFRIHDDGRPTPYLNEAVKIAIESMEKQIPKKVQIKRWAPARCPSCGMELSESCGDGYYRHPTFLEVCPNVKCCQRLDWSEAEWAN